VIAYKFLAPGAVAPFTRLAWPRPGADDAWVEAPSQADDARWVHACKPAQLPYWLEEELWRVELAAPVREERYQLAAPRARLVDRVEGWDAAGRAAFAEACAWRARDLAIPGLAAPDRDRLARAQDLAALEAAARACAGPAAGYVAFAAARARLARPALTALNTAMLAASLAPDGEEGFAEERAWQARWLAARLGLESP
jgi:hypothetical protein